MTKKKLLELISYYPEDIDIIFTDESEPGEQYEMYMSCITEDPGKSYINLWFKNSVTQP